MFSANKNFLDFCKVIGTLKTLICLKKSLFFDINNANSWELGFDKNLINILYKCPIPQTFFL